MAVIHEAPAPLRTTRRIPDDFVDLMDCPPVAALTTIMPDGHPQTTAVRCKFVGTHVLINVMRGFRKEKNMRCHARVTLLCYDLISHSARWRYAERSSR
jgi:hypothetical protein